VAFLWHIIYEVCNPRASILQTLHSFSQTNIAASGLNYLDHVEDRLLGWNEFVNATTAGKLKHMLPQKMSGTSVYYH
jgi:hypothetical protein